MLLSDVVTPSGRQPTPHLDVIMLVMLTNSSAGRSPVNVAKWKENDVGGAVTWKERRTKLSRAVKSRLTRRPVGVFMDLVLR